MLSSCPEDEPMTPGEESPDATDESLLETSPVQSPLQVFAGMGGLALIAERLPMLYPDVIQQVRPPPPALCAGLCANTRLHPCATENQAGLTYRRKCHFGDGCLLLMRILFFSLFISIIVQLKKFIQLT